MQKKMNFKKLCSLCLCILLVAAIAIFTTACTKETPKSTDGNASTEIAASYGQGETAFTFVVSDKEGKKTYYAINTNETTVGEALQQLGLIDGDEGAYGLYVKTVDGTTLDYDTDGMYWAFYIGTEMAPTGADMTDIVSGETYRFVATKG